MEQQTSVQTISQHGLGFADSALQRSRKRHRAEAESSNWREPLDEPKPSGTGEQLRSLACEQDARQARAFELAELWLALRAGRWLLRETFATEQRYYAVIEPSAVGSGTALTARSLEILSRVLLGESQKVIAIDLGVSPSTVASNLQAALRLIGVRCRGCRPPVLLTVAAHSALRPDGLRTQGRFSELVRGGPERTPFYVVSVQRPDLDLPARLSNAELAVVRALVAGRSHAEISDLRSTSRRTVANQIGAAFRKLGVSGRGEMLSQLVTHSLRGGALKPDQGCTPRGLPVREDEPAAAL